MRNEMVGPRAYVLTLSIDSYQYVVAAWHGRHPSVDQLVATRRFSREEACDLMTYGQVSVGFGCYAIEHVPLDEGGGGEQQMRYYHPPA